jgi:hypothetical protein
LKFDGFSLLVATGLGVKVVTTTKGLLSVRATDKIKNQIMRASV